MHARSLPWFVLQDAGGDVVAVAGSMSSGLPVSVAGQYTYDAYGEVQTTDHLAEHPLMHAGHKGLFFDRLDVPLVATGGTGIRSDELPRLVPYASGLYQMRNRAYSPQTGRFMQRDPNATSMVLIESAAMHGKGIGAAVAALSPDEMYGDGHNLYQYLGSNPMSRRDPLGTSWDPFKVVDDYIAEDAAQKTAFFNKLMKGVHSVGVMTATLLSYMPMPGAALIGEIALAMLNGDDIGPLLQNAAIGLIPGGKLFLMAQDIASSINLVVAATTAMTGELIQEMTEFLGGENEGPAVAGSKTELLFKGLTTAASMLAVIEEGRDGGPKYEVYVKYDKSGKVKYVGITSSLDRRSREHGESLDPIARGLTKLQARCIETAALQKYGSHYSENKLKRSVGKSRRFYDVAISFGMKELGKINNINW